MKKIMRQLFQSAHFNDAKAAFKIKIGICENDLPSESKFLALDRVLAKQSKIIAEASLTLIFRDSYC